MQGVGERARLSAGDLAGHLACRHLTSLNRAAAAGEIEVPAWRDPRLEALRERGFQHERDYAAHLAAQGREVVQAAGVDDTVRALRAGADVLTQADLADGRWNGRADFLLRVDEPSELGPWSYEVADTKLARETRGGTLLQLSLYSDLVARVQGTQPQRMHVVKPGEGFPSEAYRVAEFAAFYRLARRRLEEALANAPAGTYPDPVPHCDVCRWWPRCDARRRADDHLSLVAGLGRLHAVELERQGVSTLAALAEAALDERPQRGSPEALESLRAQAAIQLLARGTARPEHELLPAAEGRGLARLPAPTSGDVFFDIEGDPYVDGGGLEYLLGYAVANGGGGFDYAALWALDRAAEKRAFERFVDLCMARWESDPGFHVYHFAPYEPAALKRLMGRHATREAEMDRLLRGERFVDLHAVVRQGLRAGVERYSLKDLEPFHGFERELELRAASAALRRVETALELGLDLDLAPGARAEVEAYNRDDCVSTASLRGWVERLRATLTPEPPRPELKDGAAGEQLAARTAEVDVVVHALTEGVPPDESERGEADQARWLLAHLVDYFRREGRSAWWEFYRLHELPAERLLEERKALAGLRFECEVPASGGRLPTHRYRFPPQEVSLRPGAELHEAGGEKVGTVAAIDPVAGALDVKKTGAGVAVHPRAVVANEIVRPRPLDSSLLALGRSVAENGVDGEGPYRAARDLLLRRPPRVEVAGEALTPRAGEQVYETAYRVAADLCGGVLPIQGPPGSGKTYSGARLLARLAADGARIGVTAVSHRVIQNLLEATLAAAHELGVDLAVTHKPGRDATPPEDPAYRLATDNAAALAALDEGAIVGGTAWLWARDDAAEALDYLVVDEAGQMSLAQVLAASRACENLVLLGDPQQLQQPQRGAHPEGAEVSALDHLLDGRPTVKAGHGLFLDRTWRLHPALCAFTSELYYEGRLAPREELAHQVLAGPTPFAGAGLFLVAVEHEGNQNAAPEEVDAIARIVEALVQPGVTWSDREGLARGLTADDVKVVAPYNAQVAALKERLPGIDVGTVDRFQGQEAPVVVYSMTSSSAEDAPRGSGFLFDPHRLNVATSRARCACVLVASPRLFGAGCRTPEEMRRVNGLCRLVELAHPVRLG